MGANVETRDENGASAFYWAMMGGHLSVGEELISAGKSSNIILVNYTVSL